MRLSGVLAAVLLLQWAVGLAGCVASLSARTVLPVVICHADGTTSVPSEQDGHGPEGHAPDGAACPLSVQLAMTVLPEVPAAVPEPPPPHAAAVLPQARDSWVPARGTPAHPPRGPPALS